MSLSPGQRLGPYEVKARVGAGGMGEVYRATDTRLHRMVAIKVLSTAQTSRPDFSERFEREARAISSFNHPHICTVYDFGSEGQLHYLVMEYLEGETLADRLGSGPLRFEEFLRWSLHISDALVQAHRQGHLHRDIKPSNIMLTKSGAKLLDFGLTRAIRQGTGDDQETRTKALTTDGAIVGTCPYMSPEQLQGRETDARSDIFSFGAVLYEMATGDRAFEGESTASVIAAVLDGEPALLSSRRPELPPALEWIVHTCLRKDPEERWQTVHDLKLQLERLREMPSGTALPAVSAASWRRWSNAAVGVLAGMIVASAISVAYYRRSAAEEKAQAIVFEVSPPGGTSFTTTGSASIPVISSAISPDGGKLAFVAERGGVATIHVRSLSERQARSLAGTEGAQQPFWSSDSRWIAFFADNSLKKIDASSGPAISLCQVSIDPRGGAWLPSNVIVFAPSQRDGLMRISAAGGSPQPLYPNDKDAGQRWWPSPLPDGRRFVYLDRRKNGVFAGSLEGEVSDPLIKTDWAAVYAEPGYLLYFNNGALVAHDFDPESGVLRGEPVHLGSGIGAATNAMPGFSVSRNGILAHSPLLIDRTQIGWYDRRGRAPTFVTEPAYYMDPSISTDGQKLAWSRLDLVRSAQDIWLHDPTRGTTTRFTTDPLIEASPLWSGHSRDVLYRSNRTGVINLYVRDAGGGEDRALFQTDEQLAAHGGAHNTVPTSWSSDGRYVIYTVPGRTGYDIFVLSPQDQKAPQALARSAFNEIHGALSPDGRWLAFASDETGRFQIYVQSFPEAKGKQQISASGGWEPRWRADGKELYFLTDSRLSAVDFQASGSIGKTREILVVATPPLSPFKTNYQPSADGQKFVINALVDKDRSAVITVVANWTVLLSR